MGTRGRSKPASRSRLSLTEEFSLEVDGQDVGLPHSVERVVAYLGLTAQPVHRTRLAGALWPDLPGVRASRSLRTALWRLQRGNASIVDLRENRIALAPRVRVDVTELSGLCRRLIEAADQDALRRLAVLIDKTELLPDWDDEWVTPDRERFRMLRLEALEHAAEHLLERREHGRAMEAALAASLSDPLRESARRLVIRVHLAEGNVASALREYEEYRELLGCEVGVEPSAAMRTLIRPYQTS